MMGWAVATDDLQSIASRLDLEVTRVSRALPDGSTLSWRLAGVAHAMGSGSGGFPFFIEWDGPPEMHPGAARADHRSEPRGVAWVELAAEEQSLGAWLGHGDLPVRITEGPPGLVAVGIGAAEGDIVLR